MRRSHLTTGYSTSSPDHQAEPQAFEAGVHLQSNCGGRYQAKHPIRQAGKYNVVDADTAKCASSYSRPKTSTTALLLRLFEKAGHSTLKEVSAGS